jgi:hypothetical protein
MAPPLSLSIDEELMSPTSPTTAIEQTRERLIASAQVMFAVFGGLLSAAATWGLMAFRPEVVSRLTVDWDTS